MDPNAQLGPFLILYIVLVKLGVAPDLLPLILIVPNLVRVDVEAGLEYHLLALVL